MTPCMQARTSASDLASSGDTRFENAVVGLVSLSSLSVDLRNHSNFSSISNSLSKLLSCLVRRRYHPSSAMLKQAAGAQQPTTRSSSKPGFSPKLQGLRRSSSSCVLACAAGDSSQSGSMLPAAASSTNVADLLGGVDTPSFLEPSDEELISRAPGPAATATPKPVSSELRRKSWALKSVLKVFTTKVDPNYGQPWQMCPQRSSTGSAFVVDTVKRHILTNSHVVSNATAVYVRRPGLARKFKAEVICEGKVCDLALLTVREDAFWTDDLKALTFEDMPELQASIAVAGYPVGGDSLSITKGIVSRLTLVRYSPAARLLSIQIDAAINPGNSGGPAFSDLEAGRVAGVAFSKNVSSSTDNIGYVIPWRVVQHFLQEYQDHGMYRGVPASGFSTQDMENPTQKAYLKVPPGSSGVLVVSVDPLSAATGTVQVNDVLLEVDGEPVADDGTVVFRDDERLEYTFLIRSKKVGDPLQLTVLRDGVLQQVSYPLSVKDHLVPLVHGVDCQPSYFIVGGLVFTPLTSPFLEMVFGSSSGRRMRRADIPVPIMVALNQEKQQVGQQVVVLVQVLAHEINHGYKYTVVPCETFNGVKVRNLRHLAHMVDICDTPYLNFGLEGGRLVTLSRQDAAAYGPSILSVHSIATDRSEDLRQPDASDALWLGPQPETKESQSTRHPIFEASTDGEGS